MKSQIPYHTLDYFLSQIKEPNREPAERLYQEYKPLFQNARGSKTKHQAWEGGYLDHLEDAMNCGTVMYNALAQTNRLINFSLSDVYLVLALHDVEKPFKQARIVEGLEIDGVKQESAIDKFKWGLIDQFGFQLDGNLENAINYCEGEKDAYHPTERIMSPLAAFCHMCDMWSARGWYDYPLREKDPWKN